MHVAVSIICTVNLYNLCDEWNYFTLNCLGSATCALYLISDRAIMMGLMLHSKGKQLIRTEQYRDALEVLHMGEVSSKLAHVSKNCSNLQIGFCCRVLPFHWVVFPSSHFWDELCFVVPGGLFPLRPKTHWGGFPPLLIVELSIFTFASCHVTRDVFAALLLIFLYVQRIDNVPILQIDMVWCYFMIRDINLLSVAGERLAKAREGIERAHGKDASRVRMLQGSRSPELALSVTFFIFLYLSWVLKGHRRMVDHVLFVF